MAIDNSDKLRREAVREVTDDLISNLTPEQQVQQVLRAMVRGIRAQISVAFSEKDFVHVVNPTLPRSYKTQPNTTPFCYCLKEGGNKDLWVATFPNKKNGEPDFKKTPTVEVFDV